MQGAGAHLHVQDKQQCIWLVLRDGDCAQALENSSSRIIVPAGCWRGSLGGKRRREEEAGVTAAVFGMPLRDS